MDLRRADCGHMVDAGMEPNVTIHDNFNGARPGRACPECLSAARQPKVETKATVPPETRPTPPPGGPSPAPIASPAQAEAPTATTQEPATPAYKEGRAAAAGGRPQSENPYDGRKRDGKDWARGWYEEKSST